MRLLAVLALTLAAGEGGYRLWLRATAERPGARVLELYAVGGSTTRGEPYGPPLSFAAVTARSFCGKPVVVYNLGRPGESIYPQALRLRRRLRWRDRRNPAAVLIYSGHNEPFRPGWSGWQRFKERVLWRSLLLSDVVAAVERGLRLRRPHDLAAYEAYLRLAVEESRAAGAAPVLATVSSNVTGVEPNPSPEALESWRAGRWWDAVDADPRTEFGRSTRAQNEAVRRVGAPLNDTVAAFGGLPGSRHFIDGHHPNADGVVVIASGFTDRLEEALGEKARCRPRDGAEAVRAAGLTPEQLADAHTQAGLWLVGVSVTHPSPEKRLELAERNFREALRLAPGHEWARAGLDVLLQGGEEARSLWNRLSEPRSCLSPTDRSRFCLQPGPHAPSVPAPIPWPRRKRASRPRRP